MGKINDYEISGFGKIACGINALIDVFELGAEKTFSCGAIALSAKLMEISSKKFENFVETEAQMLLLEEIIEQKSRTEDEKKQVLSEWEKKYNHLLKTKELI